MHHKSRLTTTRARALETGASRATVLEALEEEEPALCESGPPVAKPLEENLGRLKMQTASDFRYDSAESPVNSGAPGTRKPSIFVGMFR